MTGDVHRTTDLFYAAFLRLSGMELLGLEASPGKQGIYNFVFRKNSQIRSLHAAFFNGTGSVQARAYVDEIKNLRALIKVQSASKSG